MRQTGNLTATLFSAKSLAQEIIILAPADWHPFLAEALKESFDHFILVDLLDGYRIQDTLQQFPLQDTTEKSTIIALIPKKMDLLEEGSGPCLQGVAVGWVPIDDPEELWPWLQAIEDRRRLTFNINYQVLSMWKPFYINWANRFIDAMRVGLEQKDAVVIPLFADETSRNALCENLWAGPQLVLYVGHGRSRGWSGYRGFRWKHISAQKQSHPIGSLLTLTCDNLKPGRDGQTAFGIRWVLEGRACAFFGAAEAVEVKPLKTIAKFFITHFSSGNLTTIGELISAVDRDVEDCPDLKVKENWRRFRLIGNPLQPL
jgi:hypothetical protein